MKKFKFNLEVVKDYKDQVLEERKREHALAVKAIADKEQDIRQLRGEFGAVNLEFNQKKEEGIRISDAHSYERHIQRLLNQIESENKKLDFLKEEEKNRKIAVIEANQEVSTLEKLREHKLEEYNKAAMKEEELFIAELVSNKSVSESKV